MEYEHWHGMPDVELHFPGLTHHLFVLHLLVPELLSLQGGGQEQDEPATTGALAFYPAGSPAR